MTKTEQAKSLFTTVTDSTMSVQTRREAMEQLTALKKAARTSFAKLGLDESELTSATADLTDGDETGSTENQDTGSTSGDTTDTPATRGKRGEKRDQAVALLAEVKDKTKREQVQHLIDNMGINANAAYYFARTCQA